jgi:hypothetical protein
MEQAFNPLGVYLNFWHPTLNTGERKEFTIAMVNDQDRQRSGRLRLEFRNLNGNLAAAQEVPFSLAPLGAESYVIPLTAPGMSGKYILEAIASPADDKDHPTVSHRDVIVTSAIAH